MIFIYDILSNYLDILLSSSYGINGSKLIVDISLML